MKLLCHRALRHALCAFAVLAALPAASQAAAVSDAVGRAFTVHAGFALDALPPVTGLVDRAFTVYVGDMSESAPGHSAVSRQFTVYAGSLPGPEDAIARSFTVYVPQTDLEATTFRVFGTIEAGKAIEASWGVRNNGPLAADRSWNDCLYLSSTSRISDTAVEVLCAPAVKQLNAGEGYVSTMEFTLPDVPSGIYWLILAADGGNALSEDNEQNNYAAFGPFAVDNEGEPVRVLPQLETIFVSREGGNDSTGYGTQEAPLGGIPFALAHAATYATAERPVRVQIAAGLYEEAVILPPHVSLFGANPFDPTETVIRPQVDALKANGGAGVVIEGGPAALRDLTLALGDDAKGLGEVTLLLVDDANATLDNVIFDGGDTPSSTGMAILNEGSSGSAITNCEFAGFTVAIEASDTGATISRNIFDGIHGDAILVTSSKKGAGASATPMLGAESDPGSTGYNQFGDVNGACVNNQSGSEVTAEMNDWGVYTDEEIEERIVGAVDFTPYLKQSFFAASVYVSVAHAGTLQPIFNASVQMGPGAGPAVTKNVDGVYPFALVPEGFYTISATAPGFKSNNTVLTVNSTAHNVQLLLQPDGTAANHRPVNHHGDTNRDGIIGFSELIRGIQLYNASSIRCMAGTEDGYAPGRGDTSTCIPYVGDYAPTDWNLSLSELLRIIQMYRLQSYQRCPNGEDGYCPGQ
jgi:hypothetical protein